MMAKAIATLLVVALVCCLSACPGPVRPDLPGKPEIVKVPVPTARTPPAELLAPIDATTLPQFISPDDPEATSALSAEGERNLKLLLAELLTRVKAWTAWATEPTPEAPPEK